MKIPWALYVSELIGTGLLVGAGLSVVIFNFGAGSPMPHWLPGAGARRLLSGFLFGGTGALIAISPVGKESGAHINPVVTLAFLLKGKMRASHAAGYIAAQLVGAALGAVPLLAWGAEGRSVAFGATTPGGGYSLGDALLGEIVTTLAMIVLLLFFLGHRRLRTFTPLLFPFLYAIMVYVEAPVSGTSTNPARSFGPSVISGVWKGWWVYWVGPAAGGLLAVAGSRFTWLRRFEVEVAKVYHFEHDRYGVFRRSSASR